MEDAYNHLLVNHLPVFATLFGVVVLAAGTLAKNKAWAQLGLVTLVAAAVLTIPAYVTGEGAEHFVEDLPGASHDLVHLHEEVAGYAQLWSYALGVLALAALVLRTQLGKRQRLAWGVITVVGLLTMATMFQTAKYGGQIRRPELRGESVEATPAGEAGTEHEASEESEPDGD